MTILGLIILGIVIDAGGGPTGEQVLSLPPRRRRDPLLTDETLFVSLRVVGVRNWSTPFVQYLGVEGPLGRFLGTSESGAPHVDGSLPAARSCRVLGRLCSSCLLVQWN